MIKSQYALCNTILEEIIFTSQVLQNSHNKRKKKM